MKLEAEMRRLVHRHLCAMAEEAKATLASCAETPSAAGTVALYEAARQIAWSLGSTLAASGLPNEPLLSEMVQDFETQFLDGHSRPGEGHLL